MIQINIPSQFKNSECRALADCIAELERQLNHELLNIDIENLTDELKQMINKGDK